VAERLAEHPGTEELQAYGQGLLAPEAAVTLEEHLADCARCCELLEQAPGDSFLYRLRDAGPPAPRAADRTADTDILEAASSGAAAVPPELANHPRYRILGVIGQGGMGVVYRAEHRHMERLVALKVIRPGLLRNPAVVQRFNQEVRAAARLQHPNIVRALDAEQAGDLHFLVMEYVEGNTLAEVVRRRGPLPLAQACDYARQAALGLQEAHEGGLVHRDVNPQNLMLTDRGQVKILDFGLARLPRTTDAPPAAGAPTGPLTGAGAVMGTADYIAPEQAADSRAADIRADIYALGCTLFYLLTGRPPFPEGGVAEKLARHAATPLPPLGELCPEVPAALPAVVARMTAKDPADRYATPAGVAQALTPFCPPGNAPPQPGHKRRRFLAAVLVLLVGLLVGVGIIAHQLGFLGPRPSPAPEETPEPAIKQADSSPVPHQPPAEKAPEPVIREEVPPTPEELEARAADALQKLGGKIGRLVEAPGKPVVAVNLADTKVTDADLRALTALPHLQNLDLSRTKVTAAGLQHISGLTGLLVLNLFDTRVADAGMKYVGELKQLQSLDLHYAPVGDEGLKHLAGLRRLYTLTLYGPRVTDAGMAEIGRMQGLTSLKLYQTEITDEGLKSLAGLTELGTLNVSLAVGVGNEGMKHLAPLGRLRSLDIYGTRVKDAGLREVGKLKQLETLVIGRLRITDEGLEALAGLTELKSLNLAETDITDAGLKEVAKHRRLSTVELRGVKQVGDAGVKELAGLPQLKVLFLSGTNVTDAGIKELAACPRLSLLSLIGAKKVTDDGVAELRQALPKLRIHR
jgi:serine/threonine protein kinase